MDKFTPYLPPFQYIDSHLPLLHSLLASRSFFDSSFVPLRHLLPLSMTSTLLLYILTPDPPIRIPRSSNCIPPQLSSLPTFLATCFKDPTMLCRFGCPSLEDTHHIFVHCPLFQHLRDEYSGLLIAEITWLLTDTPLPTALTSHILYIFPV